MNNEITKFLNSKGVSIIGFADLKGIYDDTMPYGIVVGIALPSHIMLNADNLPSAEYEKCYKKINAELDIIVTECAGYLKLKGYKAIALTGDYVGTDYGIRAKLPVKTVATRAGIGFIGKNACLITKSYGLALRLSSIITDCKFECGAPVNSGECGTCTLCKDNCPGGAINGVLWTSDKDRDELVDIKKCMAAAEELCITKLNTADLICGKCIAVCPYTSQYAK